MTTSQLHELPVEAETDRILSASQLLSTRHGGGLSPHSLADALGIPLPILRTKFPPRRNALGKERYMPEDLERIMAARDDPGWAEQEGAPDQDV